jgi:hypothetical protein
MKPRFAIDPCEVKAYLPKLDPRRGLILSGGLPGALPQLPRRPRVRSTHRSADDAVPRRSRRSMSAASSSPQTPSPCLCVLTHVIDFYRPARKEKNPHQLFAIEASRLVHQCQFRQRRLDFEMGHHPPHQGAVLFTGIRGASRVRSTERPLLLAHAVDRVSERATGCEDRPPRRDGPDC